MHIIEKMGLKRRNQRGDQTKRAGRKSAMSNSNFCWGGLCGDWRISISNEMSSRDMKRANIKGNKRHSFLFYFFHPVCMFSLSSFSLCCFFLPFHTFYLLWYNGPKKKNIFLDITFFVHRQMRYIGLVKGIANRLVYTLFFSPKLYFASPSPSSRCARMRTRVEIWRVCTDKTRPIWPTAMEPAMASLSLPLVYIVLFVKSRFK